MYVCRNFCLCRALQGAYICVLWVFSLFVCPVFYMRYYAEHGAINVVAVPCNNTVTS